MDNLAQINKKAWSYRAYEFWSRYGGRPKDAAKEMKDDPDHFVRRHISYLGDVKGKKILNALGSNGRKAVPLALLGAEVTVIDISEENARYARELALEAGVSLDYIVESFMNFKDDKYSGHFDIVFLEGGILHYFDDLDAFYKQIYKFLKKGGKLVLDDFHPIRKIFNNINCYSKNEITPGGDYFDTSLIEWPVAYEDQFPEEERKAFPKCLLRMWTTSEILNNLINNGFCLKRYDEHPRLYQKHLPGSYTIVAEKD